eukprot:CAMPEP_0176199690 /NCGR_PEP_ID=MMETSP0121_2-20121125/8683_1 /TAXON_ID=160619 /ORGANISM="Kryptoperidinium foliaceum, Strain CCMP 1326" /LENGTH=586 /DNA_ID=CAMNT_0017538549 /DNA_START=77 /DNA_END=1837 /DNA_ORIENTATION=+
MLGKIFGCGTANAAKSQEVENVQASAPHHAAWTMESKDSPLFQEYLGLAKDAGWGELISIAPEKIGATDALIVVDYQNDFIPVDDINPSGGAFGVAEGAMCSPLVVALMKKFADAGASVVCTRDYHPSDHCSFIPSGGPFPSHCVQGSAGTNFYAPVADCIEELRDAEKRCEVVFKGFHEAIDSFGALEYPDEKTALARLSHDSDSTQCHGCSLLSWTGAVCLKCSNFEADVNAPPDVMSVMRRKSLADKLKEDKVQRVFVCGLALDFCVLDTALNAVGAGFGNVRLIMDACRAAHIPQFGSFGTGFLSDPAELKAKMAAAGVKVIPTRACVAVPAESKERALAAPVAAGKFPAALSTFALVEVQGLGVKVDLGKSSYAFEGVGRWADALRAAGLKTEGKLSAAAAVGDVADRKALGVPEQATKIAWAQPSEPGAMPSTAWGYFATTSPGAALVALGGFVYLNDAQELLSVKALCHGSGLSFGAPQAWSAAAFSQALEGRWSSAPWPLPRGSGAKLFAWVGPGEVLKPASGDKPPVEVKHGAFVFLFHENPLEHDDRDVIFHVTGVSEFRRSRGAPVVKSGPRAKR